MINITVISVGKVSLQYIQSGEAEYLKRVQAPFSLEIIEYPVKHSKSLSSEQIKEADAKVFLQKLPSDVFLILLDEKGKMNTSVEFAHKLQSLIDNGHRKIVYAVGGPYGWHESVRKRAQLSLSLSRCTFPAGIARLLVTEQVYRAITILHNLPYHKA